MTLIPVALAAELAAFAFIGNRDTPNPLLDRKPIIDDTVTTLLPAAHSVTDTGGVVAAAPKKQVNPAKHAAATRDSAQEAADSAKRASGPSEYVSADEMAQLQVAPANRAQRVAVIGTSNPKITVVWISKDSL